MLNPLQDVNVIGCIAISESVELIKGCTCNTMYVLIKSIEPSTGCTCNTVPNNTSPMKNGKGNKSSDTSVGTECTCGAPRLKAEVSRVIGGVR